MRRAVLVAVLVCGMWLVPGIALADDGGDGQVVVDNTLRSVQTLSLLIGIVLPILTNFFTASTMKPGPRAVILAALSAVSGFATEYAHSVGEGKFDLYAAILTTIGTFVVAVATHLGLYAPTGVAEATSRAGVKGRRATRTG